MQLSRLLFLPYQLVRRPLGAVDEHAVQRLSPDNPLRGAYHAVLRMVDTTAAVLLDEPGLAGADGRNGATQVGPEDDPGGDETAGEDNGASDATSTATEQRERDFAHKQAQVTRGNRSPAAMRRDLAKVRAVAEARDDAEHDGDA